MTEIRVVQRVKIEELQEVIQGHADNDFVLTHLVTHNFYAAFVAVFERNVEYVEENRAE